MPMYTYSIIESEIVVTAHDHSVFWSGMLKQIPAIHVLPIINSNNCVVLLDYWKAYSMQTRNLICITPNGGILWEASPPKLMIQTGVKRDRVVIYTGAQIEGNCISAYASEGFVDYIDAETGAVIESVFTK